MSHLHADHCSGLEDYGFYSYYVLGRRARILAHPDVSARLWDGLLAAGMEQMHGAAGRRRRPPGGSTTTSTSSP